MLKKDLILRNPLRLVDTDTENILPAGGFGAVVARAGVGKTALLVQIALDRMLREKDVLHVSLGDPLDKVSLWYDEVFRDITQEYKVSQRWDSLLPHRFIMTFNVEGFRVPQFEERLTDLTEQNIISPDVVLVDGLSVGQPQVLDQLFGLKEIAKKYGLKFWFAVRSHEREALSSGSMPEELMKASDLFELVIQLQPQKKEVGLGILKGDANNPEHLELVLDPSTMLIKERPNN